MYILDCCNHCYAHYNGCILHDFWDCVITTVGLLEISVNDDSGTIDDNPWSLLLISVVLIYTCPYSCRIEIDSE